QMPASVARQTLRSGRSCRARTYPAPLRATHLTPMCETVAAKPQHARANTATHAIGGSAGGRIVCGAGSIICREGSIIDSFPSPSPTKLGSHVRCHAPFGALER